MPENNKTEEFLQKLAPCIERGELEACVEEAARVAREMGIKMAELGFITLKKGLIGEHGIAYVIALGAVKELEANQKASAYDIAGAYSMAGSAAKSMGRPQKAEELYNKALQLNPNDASTHNTYAAFLQEQNRVREAEEHYKTAIKVDSKFAAAYNNYANILLEQDKKIEAEEYYKNAIGINPNFAEAHYNYAILLNTLDRKTETEIYYKKAIELNPKFAEAYTNYAMLLKESGRKNEAEEYYKKAIEIKPKLAEAHIDYAGLLRENERFYEAEKEVSIALKIAQEDSSKQRNLPYAHKTLGDILADEDCFEEAIKEYQNALKNSTSIKDLVISEIHNNLGWTYVQIKNYDKAEKEFKKAKNLDPMNIKAIRNYRALTKLKVKPEISTIQKLIGLVLLLSLLISYYFFWIRMLSETIFATQSTILIALLIFIFLYHQIVKFKVGSIEFEKSTEHRFMEAKSQLAEAVSKIER